MNLTLKAMLLAAVLEGVLGTATFVSGWGPCGPGTPLGQIGLMTHLVPLLLLGAFRPLADTPVNNPTVIGITVGIQYLLWAVILRFILSRRAAKIADDA
jgi:hypothetical protein